MEFYEGAASTAPLSTAHCHRGSCCTLQRFLISASGRGVDTLRWECVRLRHSRHSRQLLGPHRIHQYNISNCGGGEGGGYVHHITAADGLSQCSGPGTGYSVKRSLPYPSTISVTCQTTGTNVSGGNIWDQLTGGGYVSDYWVDTTTTRQT